MIGLSIPAAFQLGFMAIEDGHAPVAKCIVSKQEDFVKED